MLKVSATFCRALASSITECQTDLVREAQIWLPSPLLFLYEDGTEESRHMARISRHSSFQLSLRALSVH